MDVLSLSLRVVLSLAFVVLVLWYIQKRVSKAQRGTRAGDPLTIVARRGLGKSSSVVVVETDGKRFVLGVTEQSVNVLHTSEAPEPEAAAVPASPTNIFALKLAEARGTLSSDTGATATAGETLPPVRRHIPDRPSPLDGSILSPGTWKQAGAALRKGLTG
ncbi:MAG TPA: flagellar biosynthetic protein FliO [Arthrobacter sp.]